MSETTRLPNHLRPRREKVFGPAKGIPLDGNAKARIKAQIRDVTFNDLRGTAVTRLAIAGATEAEIATITGHALRDVRSILDSHYLNRDPTLGENAIRKLEKGTKVPD